MMIEAWIFCFLLILISYQKFKKPSYLPPGTFGVPVLGHLPSPRAHISSYIKYMHETYGDIFTTKWGKHVTVCLADPAIIRRAFNRPELSERPDYEHNRLFPAGNKEHGIIMTGGEHWKNNRRFLLFNLKSLGMGKSHLETSIEQEVQMMVNFLAKKCTGKPVQLDRTINLAILNVIWQLTASTRYNEDDEEIKRFIFEQAELSTIVQGNMMLYNYFPWIRNFMTKTFFDKWTRIEEACYYFATFRTLCEGMIEKHQETLDPEHPRDIIDHYLLNGQQKDDPDHTDLVSLQWDLFVAGSDTTSNTIRWFILYMALNPQVQQKVQAELDCLVPKDRLPSLDDRSSLPYIEACILETLRLSSFVDIGLPHCVTQTCVVEGYTFPKDTTVFACLEMCHKSPRHWQKPLEFYPEHFIDSEGKLSNKNEAFMPFGLGKRECLGKSLATMELFLFSSAILQQFSIGCGEGNLPSTVPTIDAFLFNQPAPYHVVLSRRHPAKTSNGIPLGSKL